MALKGAFKLWSEFVNFERFEERNIQLYQNASNRIMQKAPLHLLIICRYKNVNIERGTCKLKLNPFIKILGSIRYEIRNVGHVCFITDIRVILII